MSATPLNLEAMAVMERAATAGPWETCGASDHRCACNLVWSSDGETGIARGPHEDAFDVIPSPERRADNAAFIAASRTFVPAAIAEIAELRAEVKLLRKALEYYSTSVGQYGEDGHLARAALAKKETP